MKALVVYDSLYGNTEKVARALATGMTKQGVEITSVRANEGDSGTLVAYDVIAIGGPTHGLGLSKTMKAFMKQFEKADVKNKWGFAFDTKLKSRFAGSAGKKIEQQMEQHGMKIVMPHASAVVAGTEGPLKEGSEAQFEQIGMELARKAFGS